MPERKFLDSGLVARVAAGFRYAMTGNAPDEWFGPMTPPTPAVTQEDAEAAGVAGRQFDYRTGINVDFRPRSGEAIGFLELRAFADNYDLLRLVIETRKDQLCSSQWTIQPRDEKSKDDARCKKAIEFFRMPDQEHGWESWLRMLLEDLFVIDAPTVYVRRTNGGDLYALEPIDGATIKRVIDATGRTPIDGTAYQQILKGVPAVDYNRDELIYKPRNLRTNKVYGFSPVEQIINTVNIGLRRQIMTTSYFTEGTVPDALAGVPESWTVDQIGTFQKYWDQMLSDDMASRRKLKFVPGEISKNFHETKQPPLKDMFDEWLARIVCYCFSIEATPFVAQVNRSVAETNREQSLQEGRAPIEQWVKSLIDMALVKFFGWADLEFVWQEGEIVDPIKRAERHKLYVEAKVLHPDEVRAELGRPPLTPEQKADMSPPQPAALAAPGGEDDDDPNHIAGAGKKGDDEKDNKTGKAIGKKKALLKPINRERPAVTKAAAAIRKTTLAYFDEIRDSVAEQLGRALNGTGKADDPEDDEDVVTTIIAGLDLGEWAPLVAVLGTELAALYIEAAKKAAQQIGAKLSVDALDLANEHAIEFARQRAAEMVGMKWVDDELVPNPNAQWRIDEGTREMLRGDVRRALQEGLSNDQLADALADSYAFSEKRATVIARTETARADIEGNLTGYRELGVAKKQWLTAPDCCDECHEIDGMTVGIDEEFPGGVQGAPLHPNCRCDVLPITDD
ncbi:MAG: phage minor head protein [Thiobacillus sp.]|nr:phage minor head protein [Thiobacillus sp.]